MKLPLQFNNRVALRSCIRREIKLKKLSADYNFTNKMRLSKAYEYESLSWKLKAARKNAAQIKKTTEELNSKKSEIILQNKIIEGKIIENRNHYNATIKLEENELSEIRADIEKANIQYTEIAVKLFDKLSKISNSITEMAIIRQDRNSSRSDNKKSINEFKKDLYDIYSRLTPRSREEYRKDLKQKLKDSGNDERLAEVGVIDSAKLFIIDNLTKKDRVSLDSMEHQEIIDRRNKSKPGI